MPRSIHMLLLSICSLASAEVEFGDTRIAQYGLRDEPELQINSQGLGQHDLLIRGSSYSGAGLSINGQNLKNPWSAHFNSELPMPGILFDGAEAVTGVGNISGHLVGTAALNTQPLTQGTQDSAEVGTEERYQFTLFGSGENIGGFIDWEKARRTDYDANDLDRFAGSAFVQFQEKDWLFDILTAGQSKKFGAQGYYGIPSTVYAEEQFDDTLIFASATKGELDGSYLRASTHYRDTRDQYRIPSSLFENEVISRNFGLTAEGRTIEVQHLALNLRGDLNHERVSGDADDNRTRGAVLIMPEARFERILIKAGLNSVFQTSESAEWLPVAGIDVFAGDNSTVYASYTETEQQPDFQTLYYSDPFRAGNPLLAQQRSKNAELGFRQFLSANLDWRIGGFYRRLENANDWVKTSAVDPAWNATGLGDLNIGGIDGEITFQASENLVLKAYYQWLEKESVDVYAGLYELDYPEHMLNLMAWWKFLDRFAVEFSQTTRWMKPNNARSSSDFGADASLGLHWFPRFAKNVRLSFMVDDLWGADFEPIPGLINRPTTVSAGIAVGW